MDRGKNRYKEIIEITQVKNKGTLDHNGRSSVGKIWMNSRYIWRWKRQGSDYNFDLVVEAKRRAKNNSQILIILVSGDTLY